MNIICVIPARGGSKGIRKKNLRFFDDKPLIFHVINACLQSELLNEIVVTTEDDEILQYVSNFNVKLRKRPLELSNDDTPLDPVVIDAVNWYEESFNKKVDFVVTVQPTSPLLTANTLDKAINKIISSENIDTLISVVEDTHLFWRKENHIYVPIYKERLNRQFLPKIYRETGSFVICKREILELGTRIGKNVEVFEIDLAEGIDIDNELDWYIAESLKKRVKFLFVTMANLEVGMGHLYRMLTLANYLTGYPRAFVVINTFPEGKTLLEENGYNYVELNNYFDVKKVVKDYDIVVNDILDTDKLYIRTLKDMGKFVINFEDLGDGSKFADLVFNDIYELSNPPKNHKYGYKYSILNESIITKLPNKFNKEVKNILITFGGVDQNNLTLRTVKIIDELKLSDIVVKIILGPGYQHHRELNEFLKTTNLKTIVLSKVKDMGKEMRNIDLAITSNGRTVYELASMCIPMISIAQNNRETMHLFARYNKGVKYLGIAHTIDDEVLKTIIMELISNYHERMKMYNALKKIDFRKGIKRVVNIIFNEFWRWKNERDKNR